MSTRMERTVEATYGCKASERGSKMLINNSQIGKFEGSTIIFKMVYAFKREQNIDCAPQKRICHITFFISLRFLFILELLLNISLNFRFLAVPVQESSRRWPDIMFSDVDIPQSKQTNTTRLAGRRWPPSRKG